LRLTSAASVHLQRQRDLGTNPLPSTQMNSSERISFLLIAKHFHLHESRLDQATAALAKIDRVYRRSALVLEERRPLPPGTVPTPKVFVRGILFVCLFVQPKSASLARADAYSTAGGLQTPGSRRPLDSRADSGEAGTCAQ
jgi:hypothetical protein